MEAALCPRSVLQQRALALSPAAPGRPGQRRLLGVRAPRGFRGQREAKGGPARGRLLRCPPLPLQVFLTSPTEVAKVRLQTQTQQRRPSASGPSAAPPMCPAPPAGSVPGPKYRGPLHCLATVAREEGLRGLYKGSSALLFRDGHSFATYFLSYTILCEQLTPAGHSQPGEWGPGACRRGTGTAGIGPGEQARRLPGWGALRGSRRPCPGPPALAGG